MKKLDVGRKVSHSLKVDLSSLKDDSSKDHRSFLNYKYTDGKSGCASVILMNPSSASIENADTTIRRVQDCLVSEFFFSELKEVYILNLFPKRGKNPEEMNLIYKNAKDILKLATHDEILKAKINESDFIIAAWGGPCGINLSLHDLRVKTMKELIANKLVYRISGGKYLETTEYPLHGRMWNDKLRPVKYRF